jgi:tetratricopeptide (TPR) repeat protein
MGAPSIGISELLDAPAGSASPPPAGARAPAPRRGLHAALLVFVALAFAPALAGPFVLDDALLVRESPFLGSLDGLRRAFVEPVTAALPAGATNVFYRPLSFASLWLDRAIWGERAFGFHLSSLLLHLGSTWLLFRLLRRLSAGRVEAAALGAGLWALLPVQTEAVAYIAARHDVLSGFLYLLALEVWTAGRSRWRLAAFAALAAAAFLAKEMAASLPIAAWLLDWAADAMPRGERRLRAAAAALVLAALAAIRFASVGGLGADAAAPDLLLVASAAWHHVEVLLAPLAYSIDRSRDVVVGAAPALAFLALAAALAGALAWRARRWPRPERRLLAAGGLAAAAAYGPISNLLPLYTPCADRYLYLPLAAAAIALAAAARARAPAPGARGAHALAAAGLVVLGALTAWRAACFTGEVRLYEVSLRSSPASPLLHNNLGLALKRRGDVDGAERAFDAALRSAPEYLEARFNRAVLRRERGDAAFADGEFSAYVAARPGDADGWLQWGLAALARSDLAAAIERLAAADRLRSPDAGILYHLAAAHKQAGDPDAARAALARLPPAARGHASIERLRRELSP